MTSQLTLPISKVQDRYPGNPDELFDVLVDRAENILRKAGFNQHTAPKAMAVDNRKSNDDKRDSKKQKKQPSDLMCLFYREGLRECPRTDCNRKHTGRIGQVCKSEDYQRQRYGFCNDISKCPNTHPWDESRGTRKEHEREAVRVPKATERQTGQWEQDSDRGSCASHTRSHEILTTLWQEQPLVG